MFIVVVVLFAIFSALLAQGKERSMLAWFVIGLCFGPFGLLVALMPPIKKKQEEIITSRYCPHCQKPNYSAFTTVCLWCGLSFTGGPKAAVAQSSIPAVVPSIETRLQELKNILDKGLITTEEYERKRAEILNAI